MGVRILEMVSSMAGMKGGSDYSSTSDGNGNSKKQKQKQKEKSEYTAFKYSTNFKGPLHEAIILGGSEPFFVTYSNDHLELVKKIEERNRILVPPYLEEYPYDPIEFQSLSELKEYEDMARNENIDTLYQKVKSQVILYIDQDDEIIILMSADIIWTFFQDLFPTTHYYDVNGKANGIGKSSIGHVFEGLGYRCVRMVDPTSANLFRALGKIEIGQNIMILDEADRIHQDKDSLSILKEGYNARGRVPKINPNTLKQEWFYCFCFKIRITEESLRGNVTKGVIDRSFPIKAIVGNPKHDIKEILQPANRIERFEKLHNDLLSLRKLLLCYRLIHFKDRLNDVDVGLDNRDKELGKPVLQLFYGSRSYSEIKDTVMSFLNKKNKRKTNTSVDTMLFELVIRLMDRNKTFELSVSDTWEVMINGLPRIEGLDGISTMPEISAISGVYNSSKPNEYQTQDYDTIYRNTFTKTLENFGAEHEKKGNKRIMVFDPDKLIKVGKQYGFEVDLKTETGTEADQRTKKLLGVAVHAVQPYSHGKDENVSKKVKPDKNNVDSSQEKDDKNSLYGSTARTAPGGGYDDSDIQETDPSLAETTKYLNNFREEAAARKSKVAEMAEANESGKGL